MAALLRAALQRRFRVRRCLVCDCGPLLSGSDGHGGSCRPLGCEPKAHGLAEAQPRSGGRSSSLQRHDSARATGWLRHRARKLARTINQQRGERYLSREHSSLRKPDHCTAGAGSTGQSKQRAGSGAGWSVVAALNGAVPYETEQYVDRYILWRKARSKPGTSRPQRIVSRSTQLPARRQTPPSNALASHPNSEVSRFEPG